MENGISAAKKTLNARGRLLSLERPLVMGILNVTPDSFFDESRVNSSTAVYHKAGQMLKEGADLLDVGGCSTRPGADEISVNEELDRVIPAIEMLARQWPELVISVDTWRAKVAREAVNSGASMVNDISGGTLDPDMFATVAELQVPYVLMHTRGTPKTMKSLAQYNDIVLELADYFQQKIYELQRLGCKDIIVDPGFGFAKTIAHNYHLLHNLAAFKVLGCPLLAGISRKSMIYKKLGVDAGAALNGTTALNTVALMNGASVLRVHDAGPAREIVKLLFE